MGYLQPTSQPFCNFDDCLNLLNTHRTYLRDIEAEFSQELATFQREQGDIDLKTDQVAKGALAQQDLEPVNYASLSEYESYLRREIQALDQETQDMQEKISLHQKNHHQILQVVDQALAQAKELHQEYVDVLQEQEEIKKRIDTQQQESQNCQNRIVLLERSQAQILQSCRLIGQAFSQISRSFNLQRQKLADISKDTFQRQANHKKEGFLEKIEMLWKELWFERLILSRCWKNLTGNVSTAISWIARATLEAYQHPERIMSTLVQ